MGQAVGLPVASVLVSLSAIRVAGIEAWGAFVGAMVLVGLSAQVADFGSRDAVVRAFSRDPGRVAPAWRRAAASRAPLLAIGPLVFVAAGNDLAHVAVLCAWMGAMFVSRLHDGVVGYRRAFGFTLGVEIVAVGFTLAAVLVIGDGLSTDGLLVVFAIAAIIRAVASSVRFEVLRPGPGWRYASDELRRSWPFFGLTFSGALQSRVDLYVVAALLSDPVLGTYQVLTSFVLLVQSLAGALLGPIVPALYRLGRAGVLRGSHRLGLVGGVVATAGIVGTRVAMTFLYHSAVEPATLLLAWLAMLPVFAYLPLIHLAFREGDERVVLVANLVGIAVAGTGAVLTIPALGLTGAIGAAAVAQVAILALHRWRTRSRSGTSEREGSADEPWSEVAHALSDM